MQVFFPHFRCFRDTRREELDMGTTPNYSAVHCLTCGHLSYNYSIKWKQKKEIKGEKKESWYKKKPKTGEENKFRNNFHHLLNIAALFLLDTLVAAQRHLLLASKCQNRCSRMHYCLKQIDHVGCWTDFCFLPHNSVCSHFRCQIVREKSYYC